MKMFNYIQKMLTARLLTKVLTYAKGKYVISDVNGLVGILTELGITDGINAEGGLYRCWTLKGVKKLINDGFRINCGNHCASIDSMFDAHDSPDDKMSKLDLIFLKMTGKMSFELVTWISLKTCAVNRIKMHNDPTGDVMNSNNLGHIAMIFHTEDSFRSYYFRGEDWPKLRERLVKVSANDKQTVFKVEGLKNKVRRQHFKVVSRERKDKTGSSWERGIEIDRDVVKQLPEFFHLISEGSISAEAMDDDFYRSGNIDNPKKTNQ